MEFVLKHSYTNIHGLSSFCYVKSQVDGLRSKWTVLGQSGRLTRTKRKATVRAKSQMTKSGRSAKRDLEMNHQKWPEMQIRSFSLAIIGTSSDKRFWEPQLSLPDNKN